MLDIFSEVLQDFGVDVLDVGRRIVRRDLFLLERMHPVPKFLVSKVLVNVMFAVQDFPVVLGILHLILELVTRVHVIFVIAISQAFLFYRGTWSKNPDSIFIN